MEDHELVVAGKDGFELRLYRWQRKAATVARGSVHIVHGMAEHAGRYRPLAAELVERGYEVFASDLRGHGKTASQGKLGHFADRDGWRLVISDLDAINQWIRRHAQNSSGPLFMLGHSMGSFLTLNYLMEYGREVQGAVLSGSNAASPYAMNVARLIPWLEAKRIGWRRSSPIVNYLSFASFNKRFRPTRTDFDWLSRDGAEVDRYCADPLCGFHCSNQLWFDMLGGLAHIYQERNQRKIPAELPLLIVGGEQDPVSAGDGLQRLAAKLRRAGLQKAQLKIYPQARHEILNEVNKAEVVKDMLAWLDQQAQPVSQPPSPTKPLA